MLLDYSGQDLTGRSFKRQKLNGANFSNADIRDADFSNADIRGANFSNAKLMNVKFVKVNAGLPKSLEIFRTIILLFLSSLGGFIAAFPGIWITEFFFTKANYYYSIVPGILALIILISLYFTICKKGLGSTVVAISIIGTLVGAIIGTFLAILLLQSKDSLRALSVAVAGSIASVELGFILVVVVVATSLTITGKKTAIATVVAAPTTAVMAAVLATPKGAAFGGIIVALVVAAIAAWLIDYLAKIIIKNEDKNKFFRSFLINFVALGGTSFRQSNLTNADFSGANLKSSDFRDAILIRTCFKEVKKLNCVNPGKSYLQNTQLRQLLITGQGQKKNFDLCNLRGVNLQKAILTDASFISANLSEANLQDADLSRAKLVQTQLDDTDFTGATLTGAFIEDWGITNHTKFNGVRCEYVYMRLPTQENPDPLRKPDNNKEVFADGEFGDFIKPIVDTLDLYHNQAVDPRAFAISFKQLAENHPEADLRIVGMEVRGEDKLLLRAKTADSANKSELSAEYFTTYHQLKGLSEHEIQLLLAALAEKDSQVRRLENMVITALERPSFYSTIQIKKVNNMSHNPGGISQTAGNNANQQASQGNNNSQSMTTSSSPEQKQNLAKEAAAEIQVLLDQLSQSYPTDTMSGKMALATEATKRIENDPTLSEKIISALTAGGKAALEQFLSHPAASFVINALDDWNKNKQ
jgi:uncharacterized protein YjbI with pentapeptide repeats